MALTKIKKASIIGHQNSREDVISTLQRLGMLEITPVEEGDLPFDEIPAEIRDTTENKLVDMTRAITFLARFQETKKSLIQQFAGSKTLLPEATFQEYLSQEKEAVQVCGTCHQLEDRLNQIESQLGQLQDQYRDLRPWTKMDIPLEELTETEMIGIFCGLIDRKDLPLYQEELEEELETPCLLALGEEGDTEVPFILFYYPSEREGLLTVNRRYQLLQAQFPRTESTILENLKDLEGEIEKTHQEREDVIRKIKGLQKNRDLLLAHHDAALLEKQQFSVASTTGNTEQIFLIEGWIREQDEERLQENLQQLSPDIIYESRPPQEDEDPPVALNNPSTFRPFEVVTQLYGTPSNSDIDPTLVMAPFFFLFFGLCLTDAGYGIILSLLSLLALHKIRMAGMAKKLFQLLFLGGIATFILGVLTGGWFGDLIPLKEIWFDPNLDPQYFLIVSLVLGVIHVYTGLFVHLYKNIRHGSLGEALLDQGVWILFLSGLLIKFVAPIVIESTILEYVGNIGTYLGGATLILSQGRHQKSLITRLGSGILSLYDVVGYLSDVLSYSRLLALGLATSVIAIVINSIAMMVNTIPIVGFIFMVLIMIVGHLFNLIINLISSYVHTSRLQYVEFFSKFLKAGGRPFSPFGISTTYLDLELQGQGPLFTPKE